MTLQIQQLIDLWGQPRGASLDPQQTVGSIVTDSRRMQTGGFFVPLVGERFDGHAFLEQISASGAQLSLIHI